MEQKNSFANTIGPKAPPLSNSTMKSSMLFLYWFIAPHEAFVASKLAHRKRFASHMFKFLPSKYVWFCYCCLFFSPPPTHSWIMRSSGGMQRSFFHVPLDAYPLERTFCATLCSVLTVLSGSVRTSFFSSLLTLSCGAWLSLKWQHRPSLILLVTRK